MLSAPSVEIPSVFRPSAQGGTHGPSWPGKITLKLLSPGEEFPLRTLTLPASIGRASDVRVRSSARNGLFASPYLSRHHAVIKVERGRVVVEDLGSSNGTFVNGVCVKAGEPWPLADGDLVQFGSEDDNANNAAIVAQIFYGDSPELELLSSSSLNLAVANERLSQLRPQQQQQRVGSLSFVLDDENPFADPTTKGNSHFGNPSGHGRSGESILPPPQLPAADQVGPKIAAISRSLASLGVSLRTAIPLPSTRSTQQTLQILDSIDALVQELAEEDSRRSDHRAAVVPPDADITIHRRPTLSEALRIINTYEVMFCILAVLFVYTYFG